MLLFSQHIYRLRARTACCVGPTARCAGRQRAERAEYGERACKQTNKSRHRKDMLNRIANLNICKHLMFCAMRLRWGAMRFAMRFLKAESTTHCYYTAFCLFWPMRLRWDFDEISRLRWDFDEIQTHKNKAINLTFKVFVVIMFLKMQYGLT